MPSDPTPPKLFTGKSWALAISAILVGSSLSPIREFRNTGSVSGITIGASVGSVIIGLVIVYLVARYANKPEK